MDSATVIAAWWGAIVATLAFLWEVFQYSRSGPRILVKAKAGMEPINVPGVNENEKLIFVEVVNVGDRPTTITSFGTHIFNGLLKRLFRKPEKMGVVINNGNFGPRLPYVLEAGQRWTGAIEQSQFQDKLLTDGNLYAAVFHTFSSKPVLSRVTKKNSIEVKNWF